LSIIWVERNLSGKLPNEIMKLFPRGSLLHTEYSFPFKLFLVFGMVVVVLLFVLYTQNIISGMKSDAVRISRVYAKFWQLAASDPSSGPEMNLIFEEVIQKSNFPIIITDPEGRPQFWKDVGVATSDTSPEAQAKLRKELEEMDKNSEPIPIYYDTAEKKIIHYLHYGYSPLVNKLKWMPIIEGIVVAIFIIIAIAVFRSIKRSEQRSVWVGMAKETAHQLGTPLSSLLGWLELIRMKSAYLPVEIDNLGKYNLGEVTDRMLGDVKRLERVANRFGQIGSIPELKPADINNVVGEVVEFYRLRVPDKGKRVLIEEEYGEIGEVNINVELMSWVIENLIKNSLESISPKQGKISIKTMLSDDRRCVKILIADNGKGIPPRKQNRIFLPGFTTKKRGWGLGLTLAKRIIEEYHKGKIKLVESIPNVKTVFEITLPSS